MELERTRHFAQDRTDLALNGWCYSGLGVLYTVLATDLPRTFLVLPVVVLVVAGIALGVRRRDA